MVSGTMLHTIIAQRCAALAERRGALISCVSPIRHDRAPRQFRSPPLKVGLADRSRNTRHLPFLGSSGIDQHNTALLGAAQKLMQPSGRDLHDLCNSKTRLQLKEVRTRLRTASRGKRGDCLAISSDLQALTRSQQSVNATREMRGASTTYLRKLSAHLGI